MTTQSNESTTHVKIIIDGQEVQVAKGTTIYHAVKNIGVELPIFCYHDRMPPFGACRVCLVEVDKMNKLQTSCTLVASEGMNVKTQSQLAKEGREEIIEFLLTNHPLDCPICDRGGECPLQDQTIAFGPGQSRFYEEKRHFYKPLALGPLLMLDRERCITCARCTRFGDVIAGDHALEFIDRGYKTEVGTPDGKPVKPKFIGNTIMICPVGALTSEVYRFKARPWDNQSTVSTCTLCPVGCSMIMDSRDGEIMRTRSHENKAVNDIWMCDKGWFGYEFANYKARLQKPLVRKNGKLEITTWEDALDLIAEKIKSFKYNSKLAAWGGNSLTTEENFRFQKLMREGAGSNHLDHRIGTPIFSENEIGLQPGMEISIGDCENIQNTILLGIDLTEEFPLVWLRLKAAMNKGAKIHFFGHYAPEIANHLTESIIHPPGEELDVIDRLPAILTDKHTKIAIFLGMQYLASPQRALILDKLIKLKDQYPHISINLLEGRGNSQGARLAGMHPESGPFGELLPQKGLDALKVLGTAAKEGWDFLYVAGADPAQKFSGKLWKEARNKLGFLVVQDIFLTETARQADVVLPTLCYLEKGGTFINIAYYAQKIHPGKDIPEGVYSDGEIFRKIAEKLNLTLTYETMIESLETGPISYQPHKMHGNLTHDAHKAVKTKNQKEQLFATFSHSLFDKGVRMQHNPHLQRVVKEPWIRINANEARKRSLQNQDVVRVRANGNSISATVFVDNKVADQTVVIPLGFPELPVGELTGDFMNGLEIELNKEGDGL